MSLFDIEEVKKRDPDVDPIDVCRLMFSGMKETAKHPSMAKDMVASFIDEGPLVGLIGAAFLILTVPIGGIAEATTAAYKSVRGR